MPLFDEVLNALKQHFSPPPFDPKEAGADYELNRQGSLMGSHKQGERETLANQGPLMNTVMQMLQMGGLDPSNAPGGGATRGMITPATWKAMEPEAKTMMSTFGNQFPGTFSKLLRSPANLRSEVSTDLPENAAGLLRKKTPVQHLMRVRPEYAQGPYTVGHETQHSLNADRVSRTNPLDALTISTLLRDILPSQRRGSLDNVLQDALEGGTRGTGGTLMTKLLGTISNPPLDRPVAKLGTSGNLMRAAMDEALAYTAENAARPSGNPLIKKLAEALGVKWE